MSSGLHCRLNRRPGADTSRSTLLIDNSRVEGGSDACAAIGVMQTHCSATHPPQTRLSVWIKWIRAKALSPNSVAVVPEQFAVVAERAFASLNIWACGMQLCRGIHNAAGAECFPGRRRGGNALGVLGPAATHLAGSWRGSKRPDGESTQGSKPSARAGRN